MMTLGSDDATISGLEGLVNLSGEAASVLRRLVYAIRMPTPQQGFSAVLQSTQRRIQLRRQKERLSLSLTSCPPGYRYQSSKKRAKANSDVLTILANYVSRKNAPMKLKMWRLQLTRVPRYEHTTFSIVSIILVATGSKKGLMPKLLLVA
eukprot:scaffold421377_cov55-Attheya_sp.AAC.1